jgi:hypothetical protein
MIGIKVRVEPLTKLTSLMENAAKDGAKGYAGTKQVFTLPTTETGAWVEILDKDGGDTEKTKFAKALGRKAEDLNFFEPDPNKRHTHFWSKFEVILNPNGIELNMANPVDELKRKVLEVSKFVAPSWSERHNRGEYKFVILEEDVQAKESLSRSNKIKNGWIEYGKIQESNSKLVNVLKLAGKNVTPQKANHSDFLQAEVSKLVEENPTEFLSIVTDGDFDLKVLISDAVVVKSLLKIAHGKYTLPEGDVIGNYEETLQYLKDPNNAPVKLKIQAQIIAAKK